MERKLAVKENAVELLDKQLTLRAKKGQYGIIVLASATEAYLQQEKEIGITRQLVEVTARHKFPLHIITRSDLVVRDLDILRDLQHTAILPPDLANTGLPGVFISFSFCSTDDHLSHIFEPGSIPASTRLDAMKKVSEAGMLTGASLMPLIPFLSDTTEALQQSYQRLQVAGAKYIFPASITLFDSGPADSKTLVFRAIEKHFPNLLPEYQNLFRYGFQIDWNYKRELDKRVKAVKEEYNVPDSITGAILNR